MQTTILLCRHAEVHNPERILYGRLPGFGLSEAGWRQAERLAAALAAEPISAIYTSPLLRARQTADCIHRLHPTARLILAEPLNEVFTSWQGKRWAELGGARYYEPPADPGDETMLDLVARLQSFVAHVVHARRGQTVVAVSHGDPIAIFLMALFGAPLSEQELRRHQTYYPALASINRLVFADDLTLVSRDYLDLRQLPEAARL